MITWLADATRAGLYYAICFHRHFLLWYNTPLMMVIVKPTFILEALSKLWKSLDSWEVTVQHVKSRFSFKQTILFTQNRLSHI